MFKFLKRSKTAVTEKGSDNSNQAAPKASTENNESNNHAFISEKNQTTESALATDSSEIKQSTTATHSTETTQTANREDTLTAKTKQTTSAESIISTELIPTLITEAALTTKTTQTTSVETVNTTETAKKPTTQTKPGFFQRLKSGLSRTRVNFTEGLTNLFLGKKIIDAALLEELETHLLLADVGTAATQQIMQDLHKRIDRKQLKDTDALYAALQSDLTDLLLPCEKPFTIPENTKPYVILMVGINGAGKTTTIGKLAKHFQATGKSVLLAAGDTFRAAAIEQLQAWGERNSIGVIAQHSGADSASVIYDALQATRARNIDILIADTAGRLHTQNNLLEELKKIKRILNRLDNNAPHETLLVVDAGTGQNALQQAKQFHEAIGLTGIAITKLDGTAKGGIIFAIAKQLALPIRFIGVGEGIDDLKPFVAKDFVNALFSSEKTDVTTN